ncbi:putative 50S ribosomal subunit protein L19 [Candidatus Hodgkinia cicadicola Dsem]|nr:putative 50S ribosomal subunit protein L19 [Candidatus Hodgkinia cicadicola Dsem]
MRWLQLEAGGSGDVSVARFGAGCRVEVRAHGSRNLEFAGLCVKRTRRAPWASCAVRRSAGAGWVERRFDANGYVVVVTSRVRRKKLAALRCAKALKAPRLRFKR